MEPEAFELRTEELEILEPFENEFLDFRHCSDWELTGFIVVEFRQAHIDNHKYEENT